MKISFEILMTISSLISLCQRQLFITFTFDTDVTNRDYKRLPKIIDFKEEDHSKRPTELDVWRDLYDADFA